MTGFLDRIKPYIYPSTIGTYHVRPLPWLLGNTPTVGQTLYIGGFFLLNVVLSTIGYESAQPHPWGYDKRGELLAYAGYRTGHIAFALLPLVILFSGRNNFLLWVTNWTHSTYILLHRWVARIFAVQTILHSIFLLAAYKQSGIYSVNYYEPYWLWGIVGTVFVCAMLLFSLLWLRRLAYEVFLVSHIIMAVFVIVGSWYHVYYRFGLSGVYEYWLYAASAVWFFERLVRVLRITKNGMRRATVTDVGEDHVRVDIPGLRWSPKPGYIAYAYFPTLNPVRPWENHPFSANSTAIFGADRPRLLTAGASDASDIEKTGANVAETQARAASEQPGNGTAGITLFVRKNKGLTRLLHTHAGLLTLVDGPYPNNSTNSVLKCDRVLLIGGGIGITGLLAWLRAHPNVKLAWSIKHRAESLVQELDGALSAAAEKEVLVGQRLDVKALLAQEVQAGWKKIGVVVCGPGGLCDAVRAEVSRLGRREKTVFELEVDAYSW
jgi:predicted ferric reductase